MSWSALLGCASAVMDGSGLHRWGKLCYGSYGKEVKVWGDLIKV